MRWRRGELEAFTLLGCLFFGPFLGYLDFLGFWVSGLLAFRFLWLFRFLCSSKEPQRLGGCLFPLERTTTRLVIIEYWCRSFVSSSSSFFFFLAIPSIVGSMVAWPVREAIFSLSTI